MAEGHTIHRLARDLRELIGVPLSVSSPQGRFADAKLLDGLSMLATDARGKHLLARFDIASLHVHLGLAGIFVRMQPAGPPRPQVRLRLAGGTLAWDLTAPTRCEVLDEAAVKALISRLGPDPLRSDADSEKVWKRLQRYSGSVGAALLDQSLIAGVGNVYRAEALWAIGIHPARPAAVLTRTEFDQLWQTLVSMMRQGVEDGHHHNRHSSARGQSLPAPGAGSQRLQADRVPAMRHAGGGRDHRRPQGLRLSFLPGLMQGFVPFAGF